MRERKKSKSILKGAAFFLATFAFCGVIALGTKYINHTHDVTTTIETQVAYADGTAVIDKDTWDRFKGSYRYDIQNVTEIVTSLSAPETLGSINELVGTNVRADINGTTMTIYSTNGDPIALPADSSYFFFDSMNRLSVFSHVTTMDLQNFDTSNVTNMAYMFRNCSPLTSLDLSSFNTSNVTNMTSMFAGCYALTSLDLSGFNTSNVTNMAGIFSSCSALTSLDLSSFNTSNVTNMTSMFAGCYALTSLDLSGFNTSNVTNMTSMFAGCYALTSLDLSGFNTSNVTNMSYMFRYCSALTSLDLSNFDTSSVTNMAYMFYYCYGLTDLNLSSFNTSNVTNMADMFSSCSALTNIDLSNFDTSSVTSMSTMFYGCSALTSLDLSGFNTSNVTDMADMFSSCSALTSLDLSNFNTSNVTDMSHMFYYCSALTSLDLSGFNTSNVTNMTGMFGYCHALTSLDLSNFDTSSVTNMTFMFEACSALTSLDLSGFNTSNVTNMTLMFYRCSALTSLDLSGFNTSNVTDMSHMFDHCSVLTSLDLSSFNTSNVTYMAYMFNTCLHLYKLDISSFNMSNVSSAGMMFSGCNNLRKIYLPKSLHSSTIQLPHTFCLKSDFNVSADTLNDFSGYLSTESQKNAIVFGAFIDMSAWKSFLTHYVANGQTVYNDITEIVTSLSAPEELGSINESIGANVRADISDTTMTIYSTNGEPISLPSDCHEFFFIGDYGSPYSTRPFINVTQANFSYFDTSNVTNMKRMFIGFRNLTSLNLSRFDTSNVTDMMGMFKGCFALESITFGDHFDTSNVTTMEDMFRNCEALTSLDLSNFDTSNVTNMTGMFCYCCALTSLDLSNFNTSNVTNMQLMFWGCRTLTSLDLSSFNTSKVENMGEMLGALESLTSIDLSNFDTSNVMSMYGMFDECYALTNLDLSQFDTSNVISMSDMFSDCRSLTTLNLSTFDTSKVEEMGYMFLNCYALESITFGDNFDTSNVTSMSRMFRSCQALTNLDLSNFDTSNVTNMWQMFYGCSNLYKLDISSFNMSNVSSADSMFSVCNNLRKIYLPREISYNYDITLPYYYHTETWSGAGSYLNDFQYTLSTQDNKVLIITDSVQSRDAVIYQNNWNDFKSNYSSELQNIKKVATKKGYNFYSYTYGLGENTYAYINGDTLEIYTRLDKDIELPSNCSYFFYDPYIKYVTTMDLQGFDTSNVTNMSYMFYNCRLLTSLDLSSFNTSNVTNMSYMFENCSALLEMDLSDFDFTNVRVSGLFSGCTNLSKVVMPQALSEDYDVELPATLVLESDHTQEGDSLADFAEFVSTDENKIALVKQLDLEFTVSSERFGELDVPEGIVYFYGQEVTVDGNTLTIGDKTITATAKEVDGYTVEFVGWEGITDGKVTASTVNAVFTSQLIEYTITIVVNGEEIEIEYDAETPEFALEAPLADYGMEFLGWTWEGQTEPVKNVVIALGSFGDKNYTANFGLATYTITINVDGKLETIEYTMQSDDIEINTPSSSGLTFDGWVDENGNKIDEAVVKSGSTGDRYYKATWKRSPMLKYVAIGVLAFAGVAVAVEILVGSLVLHKKKKAQSTKTEE